MDPRLSLTTIMLASGWLDGKDSTILKEQVIQFYNRTGGPSGKVILHGVSGEAEDYDPPPTGSDGLLETTLKTGKYEVRCDDPSYGCNVTNITVSSVDLKLKLQKGTKTVSKVAQGTPIRIKFTGLDPKEHDGVTLKVTDPVEIYGRGTSPTEKSSRRSMFLIVSVCIKKENVIEL